MVNFSVSGLTNLQIRRHLKKEAILMDNNIKLVSISLEAPTETNG